MSNPICAKIRVNAFQYPEINRNIGMKWIYIGWGTKRLVETNQVTKNNAIS